MSSWLVGLAEGQDYLVQFTSIPGVAQRTGATTYYIEMYPAAAARAAGAEPVMALTPGPGDVDILLATEIVEAGRMIERGFIARDRGTVICSDHRIFAIGEKGAMGDGRAGVEGIIDAVREMSRRLVHFDMAELARRSGSVINAVLFGALAGSEVLPFSRPAFEDAIRAGGIAVDANLGGFAAGYELAAGIPSQPAPRSPKPGAADPDPALPAALAARISDGFPGQTHKILTLGAARMIDYQDADHAGAFLDRLQSILAVDRAHGGATLNYLVTARTARYLALWMSYEDVIRVADLKTRSARLDRIHEEAGARPGQLVDVRDFLRPRVEEMCSILPPWLARRLLSSGRARRLLGRFTRGRRIRSTTVSGFLLLWLVARLRRWRRGTYRYASEQVAIEGWLAHVRGATEIDYALGAEVAECARLIKGYGDSHGRGLANYERIMRFLDDNGRGHDMTIVIQKLREAALADDRGEAFEGALKALGQAGEVTTSESALG